MPPLQSLCSWRRNAQTCRSWSNDQLLSAFTAPAARLSSRTVQQNQKWSPELPYSSRTGPIQQRADERQKAATSPAQPRLQGQKISQGVIKGYRGGAGRRGVVRLRGEGWFVRRSGGGSSARRGVGGSPRPTPHRTTRRGWFVREIFCPCNLGCAGEVGGFLPWSALCWIGPVLDE